MSPRNKRLAVIIRMMQHGGSLTAIEIARATDVSMRAIYRDIADLRRLGHRIDSSTGIGGGYILRPQRKAG